MDLELFEYHLTSPRNRGHLAAWPHRGQAGGAACGDLIRISLRVEGDEVVDAGFDAEGCGAVQAAGSAVMELVIGEKILEVARIGSAQVAEELGGLSAGKLHAADLAADALAVALGAAVAADASLRPSADRTLVAMSGGVDSSLVAALVAESREAVCVTLELWRDAENDAESSCCSLSAVRQARLQAHRLGLPHFTLSLREAFSAGVVQPFLEDYRQGLTPNPCIRCNGDVRIDAMLDLADRLGAADLATGHYARLHDTDEGPLLALAADPAKDQTYMLSGMGQATLERMRFPLGDLHKTQVREMAAERGLFSAKKPDSQDLCFLAGTTRSRFLARHGGITDRPGEIVDLAGQVLGTHSGTHNYTVGQRKGIGIAAPEPLYVLRTDAKTNHVVVGPREHLSSSRVPLAGVKLLRDGAQVDQVKLRYKSKPIPCRVVQDLSRGRHRRAELVLLDPAEAVTPGQAACLMSGDLVVGVATIAPM